MILTDNTMIRKHNAIYGPRFTRFLISLLRDDSASFRAQSITLYEAAAN